MNTAAPESTTVPAPAPAPAPTPLRPISSITILGESYDLAINGDHYHLVEHKEPDAYLRPVARKVELNAWMSTDRVQALLDLAGEQATKLGGLTLKHAADVTRLESELERAHAALQREAEPEAKTRRPVAMRETQQGVVGVLEGVKEGTKEETP